MMTPALSGTQTYNGRVAEQGSGSTSRAASGPAPEGARPREDAPRRSEILAALSLAIDLGLGLRMADALGIDQPGRGRIYYANLIAWIGCHADSHELAELFGDDINFRADYYFIDAHGLPMLSLMLRHTGTGLPRVPRTLHQARFTATAKTAVRELIRSPCTSAGWLAYRVGLDGDMPAILSNTFERWDALGLPAGTSGVGIPLEMRIAQLANTAEVFLRTAGLDAAVATVGERRGTQFDPVLADLFCARAAELTNGLLELDPWPAALAAAPSEAGLGEEALDAVLAALGDFADLKSPWTAGHSRQVASLAAGAAQQMGCGASEVSAVRRAGWVHDLGRMGVSNVLWDKAGPLTSMERERLAMYPFLSERILGRIPAMRRVAEVAGAHRERLDGSGYPRGRTAEGLGILQRVLAAADACQSWLEPRPHRAAMTPAEAAARLQSEVHAGRLDPACVDAVLSTAGQKQARRRDAPAGLTTRELEVLRLLCRGMDNKAIAQELFIAPKTARNHVEHIHEKTGCSNRVTVPA